MEREACVCDHRFERSDLCAEIITIIIISRLSVELIPLSVFVLFIPGSTLFGGIIH